MGQGNSLWDLVVLVPVAPWFVFILSWFALIVSLAQTVDIRRKTVGNVKELLVTDEVEGADIVGYC